MTSMSETENHTIGKSAALAIGAIAVAVAGFAIWVVHAAGPARAALEQQRQSEIAEESRQFCEKRGQPAGTEKHVACTADLKAIREQHEKRIMADLNPL